MYNENQQRRYHDERRFVYPSPSLRSVERHRCQSSHSELVVDMLGIVWGQYLTQEMTALKQESQHFHLEFMDRVRKGGVCESMEVRLYGRNDLATLLVSDG